MNTTDESEHTKETQRQSHTSGRTLVHNDGDVDISLAERSFAELGRRLSAISCVFFCRTYLSKNYSVESM